jgi:hypothetical protein
MYSHVQMPGYVLPSRTRTHVATRSRCSNQDRPAGYVAPALSASTASVLTLGPAWLLAAASGDCTTPLLSPGSSAAVRAFAAAAAAGCSSESDSSCATSLVLGTSVGGLCCLPALVPCFGPWWVSCRTGCVWCAAPGELLLVRGGTSRLWVFLLLLVEPRPRGLPGTLLWCAGSFV